MNDTTDREPVLERDPLPRPFEAMRSTGLLWLIDDAERRAKAAVGARTGMLR